MEFRKCMYARFRNDAFGFTMFKGDIFAVTDKISRSQVYMDGVNTRNFVPVDIKHIPQLEKVVNMTPDLEDKFIEEWKAINEPEEDPEQNSPVPGPDQTPDVSDKTDGEPPEEIKICSNDPGCGKPELECVCTPEVPDDQDNAISEKVAKELVIATVDEMDYTTLQTYAKELENKFNVEINRGAKKAILKAEIKKVLEDKLEK